METVKLNNGVEMPMVGFGVFQVKDLNLCEQAVTEAISVGYRLFDTASVYENESAVGAAIRIADKHGKSVAQVILRWDIQRNVPVIPKSVHRERMEQNFDIWDFGLSSEEMAEISALDLKRPQMMDTRKPSEVRRVYGFKDNPVITSL